jgi:hypothetical protein
LRFFWFKQASEWNLVTIDDAGHENIPFSDDRLGVSSAFL